LLAEIGIKVEENATVADDELSDSTIYSMAARHGYWIAADVTARDVAARMPWLSPGQCNDVASKAAEEMGDSLLVGDSREDAIAEAIGYWAKEVEPPVLVGWEPLDDVVEPYTDSQGRTWTAVYGDTGTLIMCSDGRTFEESGSEWSLVVETAKEEAADAPA
jgi:hypothetical protein